MKTELLIAWRYIKSKRREKFISAIGIFSLVGIALGVATLIIVTSVMNGFRKEFTERVIGFNGHISMSLLHEVPDYEKVAQELLLLPSVKQAVPMIERQGLISNGRTVRGSFCHGISQKDLIQKDIISKNIITGSLEDFNNENSIVLGYTLAQRTGLNIGDDVVVIVPEMDETGLGFVPRKKTFQLAATFKSGMHEYDCSVSFIPLQMAQKLFKIDHSVSAISVFLKDPMKVSETIGEIENKYGSSFYITDWQANNSSFMKAVEIERNVMFLILTLITLVASFNIISCMIMLVKDKEKDIAILKTIGISQKSIMRIFFMVGASIGITGTAIGTLGGVLFSANIQKIQAVVEKLVGMELFSPEVYFLTHLPSMLSYNDVILIVIVALLLSCISTLYPAKKASKINPVDVLRYF